MIRLHLSILTVFCIAAVAQPVDAKKRRRKAKIGKASDAVKTSVREVLDGLKENSDPDVRVAVFKGFIELGGADEQNAITIGLKEKNWAIRGVAIKAALLGKNRTLRKRAKGDLIKLLESGVKVEREQGYTVLSAVFKDTQQVKIIKGIAKTGSKDARTEARAALIKRGGKGAWSVIKQGLAEAPSEPEHAQAMEALKTYRGEYALKWALSRIHVESKLGELARGIIVGVKGTKRQKKVVNRLLKIYSKAKAQDNFEQRVRVAWLLAELGQVKRVTDSLWPALSPIYTAGENPELLKRVRRYAWLGLRFVRDASILSKMVSKSHKQTMKGLLLGGSSEEEMALAYDWLLAWAKYNNDPKVIAMLQAATRSNRVFIRINAMNALGAINHRPSQKLFLGSVREGRKDIRLASAQGLAAVGKPGDEALLGKLMRTEPDEEVKLALIDGLSRIGTPAIIGPLQFAVMDRSKKVKGAVAIAIAKVGGPKAATLLSLLKRDPDLDIRFMVWQELLKLKSKALESEFMAGALTWLSKKNVEALAADDLIPLDIFAFVAEKGLDSQRPPAVKALKKHGMKAATRLLTVYELSRNEDTASDCLQALSDLRGTSSVGTYRKALKSEFGRVRAAGFAAIGTHGPKALLETAQAGLKDKDPLARVQAARAFLKLARRAP